MNYRIIITFLLLLLASCSGRKLTFEKDNHQWCFVADSNIVSHKSLGTKFDFFVETDIDQLWNEGMYDDDEYYDKEETDSNILRFYTKSTFRNDNPRRKLFGLCLKRIPAADSVCFTITDNFVVFLVKKDVKWPCDYYKNVFDKNWINNNTFDTPTRQHIEYSDSIVLRNVIIDHKNMISLIVDRFRIKNQVYGIAYIDLTVSKKFPFNSYTYNVAKPENLGIISSSFEYYEQFSTRFVKENNFDILTDHQNAFAKLAAKQQSYHKLSVDKIPLSEFENSANGISLNTKNYAVFDSETQFVYDFGKDSVKGFEEIMIGNITLTIAPNSNLSQIVAHIPILKKEMFSINDRIMVFEFDKNTKWLPNYEFKADEYFGTIVDYEYYPDEKPEDIWSPSHKKQPYNMVWRNLVFLHQSVIVVDRMILQDKYIAVAYILRCRNDNNIGGYNWNLCDLRNAPNTNQIINQLCRYTRRLVLSNNYWTVLN